MLNVKFKNSKKLLKVLGTIDNILRKNKEENKLKYIKLEKINDKLCFSARNLYMRLSYIIENTLNIEGDSILYDSKMLISLLNVLDGEIHIKDNIIKNNKCEYDIPYINPDGYPEDIIPIIINKKELNTERFKEAIENVITATSKTEGILSGIYIDSNKLVSCDQNRIFIKYLEIQENLDNIILSKELVNEILKLPFEETIYMSLIGNNVIIEDSNLRIVSNFIVGKYPKYEMMLPKDIKYEIIFNKQDLENALNMLLPIIDTETMHCELEIEDSNINILVNNGNKKAKTNINIENTPIEKFKVKFNARYLLDMLKANENEIKINTYNDNIGFSFTSDHSKQFIMPMIN